MKPEEFNTRIQELICDLEIENFSVKQKYREIERLYENLLDSYNRHVDLFENAPVGYLNVNSKGLILDCNKTAADLMGSDSATMTGKLFSRYLRASDRMLYYNHLVEISLMTEGEQTKCFLHLISPKGGVEKQIQLYSVPASNPITQTKIYRTVIVDISAQKRAEDAEAASDSKSVFLANMSHEIRTPLGAMMGFVKLLKDPELSESRRKKYFQVIERNGAVLSTIIDEILDLSKIEANKMEFEHSDFSLGQMLGEIEELLKLKASEKGLLLHLTHHTALERIKSDPIRLRQILVNIIGNAIKFTSQGSVTIDVSDEKIGDDFSKLYFRIQDTGDQIQADQRERLFKNFSQGDSSTTRSFGGTGLGLALSRQFANALGGDVVLEEASNPCGNTFTISVTVGLGQSLEAPHHPRGDKSAVSEISAQNLCGMRILVVEDSPDNQLLLDSILSDEGAEVEFADNGQEGVDAALQADFDLVLMDVQMPIMDGHQAARKLRGKGYGRPIIALSAHAMKEDRQKSLNAGCDGHLTKPINVAILARTIQYFVERDRIRH